MFSAKYILKICILLSVLVCYTQSSKSQSEEKKINIKIGFDLTQGENGAPSLKIRDFVKESNEFHPRASEGKEGPSVRADSFSENSAENEKEKKVSSKEAGRQAERSESKESSDDDSNEKRGISTRGMDDEYEPAAARLGKEPSKDKSKESSSAEESATGEEKDGNGRRNKKGARRRRDTEARQHDAPGRIKRNVPNFPNLKGLMENIRKRSRELFVADRRQAEKKTPKA